MPARSPLARIVVITAALLGLAGLAASRRLPAEDDSEREGWVEENAEAAPSASGDRTLVLDLDDGASDDAWTRARDAVARGVAPLAFTVDDSPRDELGALLSDDAELYRLRVPASEVNDVLRELASDADVEAAEVERTWSIPEGAAASLATLDGLDGTALDGSDTTDDARTADREGFTPNDPYYRHQWHLDLIGMPRAWTRAQGDGVVVAVIDTGVAYRDGDGFVRAPDLAETRFVDGWDFVDGDAFADDEHGHGTHVAGTIAQSTNNQLGVAGVAPGAAIMPVRVLDANGAGAWGNIAAAIRFAADHGAHVINMSLGGGLRSRTVERAIAYAHAKGVVVVAAAGNTGRAPVEYPARHAHVIAVGAVRFDREISPYSSRGAGLDVAAPGGDLRVDQNGDGLPDGVLQNTLVGRDPGRFDYLAWQGTSMAAPHVAGVAALVRGVGVSDPDAVERVLVESAESIGDASLYGRGLVRADAALTRAADARGESRGLVALLLAALALVPLARRRVLARPGVMVAAALLGAALAGGLAWLPWSALGAGGLSVGVAEGVASVLALTGAWGMGLVGVLALAAAPVGLVLVGYQWHAARPWLVALALASSAALAVEALDPSIALGGGWLAGPVLVGLAAMLAFVARQVARTDAAR